MLLTLALNCASILSSTDVSLCLTAVFDQGIYLFTNIYQRSKNKVTTKHQGHVGARAGWVPYDEVFQKVKRSKSIFIMKLTNKMLFRNYCCQSIHWQFFLIPDRDYTTSGTNKSGLPQACSN
jgi:hypothetical protein